jgi:ribonuclease HII
LKSGVRFSDPGFLFLLPSGVGVADSLFPEEEIDPLFFEKAAHQRGYRCIAGIDEAGRGPLAGPVVAAAVILPALFDLPGLTDSKRLSARQRETLYPLIRKQAVAVGIGLASADDIDRYNILQATLQSMHQAVGRLNCAVDFLLVDGISRIPTSIPQETLKKGDLRSLSISAASIVAKVIRDRIMITYDKQYPEYGFARHKGYGSAEHMQSIARCGPTPLHRKTFRGVKEYVHHD